MNRAERRAHQFGHFAPNRVTHLMNVQAVRLQSLASMTIQGDIDALALEDWERYLAYETGLTGLNLNLGIAIGMSLLPERDHVDRWAGSEPSYPADFVQFSYENPLEGV